MQSKVSAGHFIHSSGSSTFNRCRALPSAGGAVQVEGAQSLFKQHGCTSENKLEKQHQSSLLNCHYMVIRCLKLSEGCTVAPCDSLIAGLFPMAEHCSCRRGCASKAGNGWDSKARVATATAPGGDIELMNCSSTSQGAMWLAAVSYDSIMFVPEYHKAVAEVSEYETCRRAWLL